MAAMTSEERRDNFVRLGAQRANAAVDKIRLIGNLSETGRYEYTPEDVAKVFSSIREELEACEARFRAAGQKRRRGPISFDK
jgi:hypothetical protein